MRCARRGFYIRNRVRRHQQLLNKIFSGELEVDAVAKDLNERADKKEEDIRSIILSDEDISIRKNLEKIARFKEYFDVKIIMFLRRQDLWLESWYFQNVKWQWNRALCHLTFPEFLKRRSKFHWINYDSHIAYLEKLFGKENLLLSVLERSQMPEGPIAEFCKHFGVSDLGGMKPPPLENASYEPEFVEFVRHLPLHEIPDRERDILLKLFEKVNAQHILGDRKSNQRVLALKERKRILKEYDKGNKHVAQSYFGRDQLFLEPLPTRHTPVAKLEMPRDSGAAIERYVAPLLLEMYESGYFKP